MRRLIGLVFGLAILIGAVPDRSLAQVSSAVVVATCGAQTYTAGKAAAQTQDTTGKQCAGLSGGTVSILGFQAVPSTDASSTITLGGTYQTVFAADTTRKGCTIQNADTATEALSVRVGGTTVWNVPAGTAFTCGFSGGVVSNLVEVTATTTGHAFAAAKQ